MVYEKNEFEIASKTMEKGMLNFIISNAADGRVVTKFWSRLHTGLTVLCDIWNRWKYEHDIVLVMAKKCYVWLRNMMLKSIDKYKINNPDHVESILGNIRRRLHILHNFSKLSRKCNSNPIVSSWAMYEEGFELHLPELLYSTSIDNQEPF